MHRIRGKLTYSNVISTLCLFLLIGGGTAYAANQMLPKNSVGAKQIQKEAIGSAKLKNGAVTGPKIAPGAVTGSDIQVGTLGTVPSATNAGHAGSADNAGHATNADNATHATNADTAGNALNLGGKPASAFAPSNVVRSATIEKNGTVVASQSSGIAQANVTSPAPGSYCINGLDPAPVNAVATLVFGAARGSVIYLATNGASCQIQLETEISNGTATEEPFQILVH